MTGAIEAVFHTFVTLTSELALRTLQLALAPAC